MDSWDLENLKYLKKMSKANYKTKINHNISSREINFGNESLDYAPYTSVRFGRDIADIGFENGYYNESSYENYKEIFFEESESEKPTDQSFLLVSPCVKSIDELKDDKNEEKEAEECKFMSINNDLASLTTLEPLETSCLFDVISIRNESVFASLNDAENGKSTLQLQTDEKSEVGVDVDCQLAVSASTPKTDSDFDEGDGKTKLGCFHTIQKDDGETYKSLGIRPWMNMQQREGNPDFSHHNMRKYMEYFYFGEKGIIEDNSLDVQGLREEYSPEMSLRTPSPYYVRLRRNLLSFNKSDYISQPQNFGMDTYGQLLIDYSQNWDNLEKYIRNFVNPSIEFKYDTMDSIC